MMSAKEAASQSLECLRKFKTEELRKIEIGIKREIQCGRRIYSYEGYISKEAKHELEQLGYNIETGSQYNQGYVTIKW